MREVGRWPDVLWLNRRENETSDGHWVVEVAVSEAW